MHCTSRCEIRLAIQLSTTRSCADTYIVLVLTDVVELTSPMGTPCNRSKRQYKLCTMLKAQLECYIVHLLP